MKKLILSAAFCGMVQMMDAHFTIGGHARLVSQTENSITILCAAAEGNCLTVFDDGSAMIWWRIGDAYVTQEGSNAVYDEATETWTMEL